MKDNRNRVSDNHCNVLEQRRLVSEMTQCDQDSNLLESKYECYLRATQESRENKACMYS